MNTLEALNRAWFLQINGADDAPAWLVNVAIGIAEWLIYLISLLLVAMWLWGNRDQRALAIKSCLVVLIGLIASQVIGMMWPHPRPFMIGLGHTWLSHVPDPSLPSDHATIFAGVAMTFLADKEWKRAAAVLFAGLGVAWARVFVGVHFPMDMIGAATVGALALANGTVIWHKVGTPVTDFAERVYRQVMRHPIEAGWIEG